MCQAGLQSDVNSVPALMEVTLRWGEVGNRGLVSCLVVIRAKRKCGAGQVTGGLGMEDKTFLRR